MSDGPQAPTGQPVVDGDGDGDGHERSSIVRNAGALMGSQLLTWGLTIATTILLARYLGPVAIGQLRLAAAIWMVGGVAMSFGMPVLLTKTFSRDTSEGQRLLGPSLTLQYGLYVLVWLVVGAFVVVAEYDPATVGVIAVVGVGTAIAPVMRSARATLEGLERMGPIAIADSVSRVLHAGGIVLLVLLRANVFVIAAASAIPPLVTSLLMVRSIHKQGHRWEQFTRGVRRVVDQAKPYVFIEITRTAYQQIDVIVISLLASAEAIGWYGTADGLFGSLMFIPSVLVIATFPRFARLHVEDPEALRVLVHRAWRLLVLLGVPIGLGTVAVATPVAVLLYGEEFREAGPVMAVFGAVVILVYMTTLVGRYSIAIDQQVTWVRLMAVATLFTVALDIVLVPWSQAAFDNGAIGGATAYLFTETFLLVEGVRRFTPWLVTRGNAVHLGKTLLAGGVMLGAVWPLRELFVLVPVAVGAVVFVVVALLLRVADDEEKRVVRQAVARVTGRGRAAKDEEET